MSKASRQSITLLAIVNSVFITLSVYEMEPKLAPLVEYGRSVCKEVMKTFPETGDKDKNYKWSKLKLSQIDLLLNDRVNLYNSKTLMALSMHILADLTTKIRDTKKLEILEPLHEVIVGLSDALDPEGEAFDHLDEANDLITKVNKLLEL